MIDSKIAVSTADIIMVTPLPFHALNNQPRLHFAEYECQVFYDAGSTCMDIFNTGTVHSKLKGPLPVSSRIHSLP